jgi:hypothetical protein
MKLKRINETKFPTEKQLQDILHNLKQKFPKDKFVISAEIVSKTTTSLYNSTLYWSLYHLSGKKEYYIIIGVEWSDFLTSYKEFMKGENDE